MERSKRADRAYLLGWVKIAAVCLATLAVAGVVAFFLASSGEEETAEPVFVEGDIIDAVIDAVKYIPTYEDEVIGGGGLTEENGESGEGYCVAGECEEGDGAECACEECACAEGDGEECDCATGACHADMPKFTQPAFIPTRVEGVYRPKIIALTFDDGPVPITNDLLDILDYYGGRVTFCVIGDLVEEGADIVRRAHAAGHEIVGHSWDHSDLTRASKETVKFHISATSEIIEYVLGEPPLPLFRVPFGVFNAPIQNAARYLGYGVLNWSIDPADWRYRCEHHIYEYIMRRARDGAIVVLHDIYPTTIYAMAMVIPALLEAGYELVTASEVIYHVYGEIVPGFEFTGTRR